ncbi:MULTISPECIES: AI-2E family transporter [Megasphaera]|uniref:PF01594 domain protein n=1 Tax=Megasphaera vaginalis (ex Srinivasan et al. 2021) TaxID=1111454 RepID=U7UCK4_9FIRM|nr:MULTISPECIES: AI-2E family transporter [Megasphaera]ERT57105.1 PF01594 domain protein [Megasphaera vaginalis (ex Srinivasan et al. 2021)]
MTAYKEAQFWLRVVLAVFAVALFLSVHAVYWPVVVSLIITFVLIPVRDGIGKGLKKITKRDVPVGVSIILSFAVLLLTLFIITNIILRPLLAQVNLLAANFNTIVNQMAALVTQLENEQTQFYVPDQVKAVINDTFVKISNYGIDGIRDLIRSIFVIAGTVVEFFVVPFITFYFMKDGKKMVNSFIAIYPPGYTAHIRQVFIEIHHVLSRYIRGQLLMSCIIATLTFCGMWFMGVPYPMVIGLLAAVTEWIPIIGPIIGAVPAVLLGATVDLPLAVKVLVFYVVVQQMDSHLIMPQVMGAVISIHPVVIMISLLVGGTLFGVTGMVLAVPITAVLQIIGKHLWFYNSYKEKADDSCGKNERRSPGTDDEAHEGQN